MTIREAKEGIRKEALEMYGYTEEDILLVFFGDN